MMTPLVKKVAGVSALALAGGIFGGCLDQDTQCELIFDQMEELYDQFGDLEQADGTEAEALNAILVAQFDALEDKAIILGCNTIEA